MATAEHLSVSPESHTRELWAGFPLAGFGHPSSCCNRCHKGVSQGTPESPPEQQKQHKKLHIPRSSIKLSIKILGADRKDPSVVKS